MPPMLDRTRRLVSGAVDLAKEVVGPGKKVEEGRAGLDAFVDGLDAHRGIAVGTEVGIHVQVAQVAQEARDAARPAFGVLAGADVPSEVFDVDGGDGDGGGWDFGGDGGDGGGGD